MKMPLLTTKLFIPQSGQQVVPRPRLLQRLNEGLSPKRRLLLVSAPAGSGKTTLVSSWIHQHHLSAAWVSLDEQDNDPQRFWMYVVAALQTVDATLGQDSLRMLQSPQPSPVERVIVGLINDLVEILRRGEGPDVLVLDDYHLITVPKIHDSLDFFLRHLPPEFSLALTTREDPPLALPRLRSRGQLTEIHAADLRFTPEEAGQLFEGVMGLDLAPEDVTTLFERTEGWAVGLQMAALALRRETHASRREFVRRFAGSDRLIADYLTDEVLRGQRPQMQTFLLQTSILGRLCEALSDAVTGRHDGQQMLVELERSNLFITSLDRTRNWYRYHRLFAEMLRHRLERQAGPEELAALHQRAREWYVDEGLWEDAIPHALQAADDRRAVDLVAQVALPALMRGEFVLVERWLGALPEELVRGHPILCIARACCALPYSGDRAQQWIERAESQISASLDQRARGAVHAYAAVLRVAIARNADASPNVGIELCQAALEKIPETNTELRALVAFWMGDAYLRLGDDASAGRAFERAMQIERAGEQHTMAVVMQGVRAWRNFARGRLHEAAAICREMLGSVVEPAERAGRRLPLACYLYIVLGEVHLEWNELEEAGHLLARGVQLGELMTFERPILVEGYCALAMLRSIEGDFEAALDLLDGAEQLSRMSLGGPGDVPALRARVWLRRARVEGAGHSLNRAIAWAEERANPDTGAYSVELQSVAQVRIAQYRAYGEPDLKPVLAMLDEQLRSAEVSGHVRGQIEACTLKALALQAQDHRDAASALLERALTLARPERFVRSIVDHGPAVGELLRQIPRQSAVREYARELLALLVAEEREEALVESRPAGEGTALVEPLTPRELEVLAIIATGASNAEIARELYIAVNTVKTHITHIFGKLGVTRRTEAMARGRELGLID